MHALNATTLLSSPFSPASLQLPLHRPVVVLCHPCSDHSIPLLSQLPSAILYYTRGQAQFASMYGRLYETRSSAIHYFALEIAATGCAQLVGWSMDRFSDSESGVKPWFKRVHALHTSFTFM